MTPGEYIEATGGDAWQPGTVDCTTWVADWVLIRTGRDPFAAYRGTYSDEAGMAEKLARRTLAEAVEADFGLPVTNEAQPGDVGVVQFRGEQVSALVVDEGRWAIRQPPGIVIIRAEPIVALRVEAG